MPSLSTLPAYPPPGRQVTITVALTNGLANFVRVWVTDAPLGSDLRGKLEAKGDKRNRFQVYEGPGEANAPWRQVFEVGGAYTFVAQEYTRGAYAYGGGFEGDVKGARTENKVGSETTLTLHIGQRFQSPIRAGNDSVDLVFWVWDDTIRATSKAEHGEETPALTKESPTARELAAMESTTVKTVVDALVDDVVTTARGTISTILGNSAGGFTREWNDHLADAVVHEDADANNLIPTGLASAAHSQNLREAINEILALVRNHYTNDAVKGGTVSGRDSGNYHNVAAKVNDNVNMPIVQSASTPLDAYWAAADLWRSYEAHRASTAVHDAADSTNTLTALPSLLQVALQVYTVWASTSPTTPTTQSDGAMALIAYGFEESPLPAA